MGSISEMVAFLERHRPGLLSFLSCAEKSSLNHLQSSADDPVWVPLLDLAAIPKTTNAAEHIFRCLRRYLHGMDHVGNEHTTQGFFDLFVFFSQPSCPQGWAKSWHIPPGGLWCRCPIHIWL